jgi:hypothetical protein
MKGVGAIAVVLALFVGALLTACGSSRRASIKPIKLPRGAPGQAYILEAQPRSRLIVPGHSIGGIRLGESRRNVERALGRGTPQQRGLVSYFGGRLIVDYVFHVALTKRVQGLWTRWSGFHTRSGVHVGSSRGAVRTLHFACGDGSCSRAAGPMPDAPGTIFMMQHGKVVEVEIFYA